MLTAKITIRTISGARIRPITKKIVAEAFLEVDIGTRQRGGSAHRLRGEQAVPEQQQRVAHG